MSDNVINSDVQISVIQPESVVASSENSYVPVSDLQISSDITSLKETAATTMMNYLQAVDIPVSDIEAAHALLDGVAVGTTSSSLSVISDVVAPTLVEATSVLVNHVGELLSNSGASDVIPSSVLMQDIQEIWKSKTPADTFASTVSSVWQSVKTSEHLPAIAGMLASIFVKKH